MISPILYSPQVSSYNRYNPPHFLPGEAAPAERRPGEDGAVGATEAGFRSQ